MRLVAAVMACTGAVIAAFLLVEPWPTSRSRRLMNGRLRDGAHSGRHPLVQRWRDLGARRRSDDRRRLRVVRALSALASELEAGQLPAAALIEAGDDTVWPSALAAAHAHGDVAAGLRADSNGQDALWHLAACWDLARDSGAGLSSVVSRLAESTRKDNDSRLELTSQLAGPRATARMLSLLPLVGLLLGTLMGAAPLVWLVATPVGLMCLLSGVALTALGAWWTSRIATAVEKRI
jgi:tight adherence protein B